MRVRALSFDLFDTLVDLPMTALPRVEIAGRSIPTTAGALHAAFAARHAIGFEPFTTALREVDREWRETFWEQGRELPTVERFEKLLERLAIRDATLPAILTEVHMGLLAGLARAPEHHAPLLDRLGASLRLGLCSNFSHSPTALAILDEADLRARLHAIVISHDHGLRKPRPEIFESLLDALGASAEEVVHVGDNLDADVAGAAALGMRTAWVTRCVADPAAALARYTGPRPTWTIGDLAELEAIVTRA
jgi:FMN phosphatase YigB (HAD superfamily)